MIKVNWNEEEMIPLVNICFTHDTKQEIEAELSKLSKQLNFRAKQLGIARDEKFRNLTGLKMIYQNVLFVITNGEKGLSQHSKLVVDVVRLYQENKIEFDRKLDSFYAKYGSCS